MPTETDAVIRFIVETDAHGTPVQSEHTMRLERVWPNLMQRFSNLVLFYTRDYQPLETARPDVYRFEGHSSGSGVIVLEGFSGAELDEARDQLRTDRIGRLLGRADAKPTKAGTLGLMAYFPWALRTPVLDLVGGIVGVGVILLALTAAGLFGLVSSFNGPSVDVGNWLGVGFLFLVGVGAAVWGFSRHARRRRWWADARSLALQQYGTLPVYLRR